MNPLRPISILFVCLGNICRSPLAECLYRHRAGEEGDAEHTLVDSAGTGGWHVGEPPDRRSVATAAAHGISVEGRARQLSVDDLHDFDWIIAMDESNLRSIQALRDEHGGSAKLALLRDFDEDPEDGDVPDPYYGGADGFERVFEIVNRSVSGLLSHLSETEGPT